METSGIPEKLALLKINEELGCGVFAKQNIEPKEFIGIYSGLFELIQENNDQNNEYAYDVTEGILKQFLSSLNLDDDGSGVYFLRTNALKAGNFTKYINHSNSPNVDTKLRKIDNHIQILLFALKPIQQGCQLFLDYGEEYWKKMGIKPKELNDSTYIFGSPPQDQK